jgi:adenylate cyclase
LPDWPYGFRGSEDQRLTGSDLAAIAMDVGWTGHLGNGTAFNLRSDVVGGFTYSSDTGEVTGQHVLRDDLLCQTAADHPTGEVCGPVYRNTSEQNSESPFVFVSAEDVR